MRFCTPTFTFVRLFVLTITQMLLLVMPYFSAASAVVYGIKKADATEGRDCLTLVTLVKSTAAPISVTDVLKRAREYNQILFDVFHWCVKEEIINNMK